MPDRLTRRQSLRFISGGAIALAAPLIGSARSAEAGISWCRTDPLITVNGKTGHVYVESTAEMWTSRSGPIQVTVVAPVGSEASAVPLDHGFGLGYTILFREDAGLKRLGSFSEVRVEVVAPALNGSLPVRVIFHSDDPGLKDSVRESMANLAILTGAVKI